MFLLSRCTRPGTITADCLSVQPLTLASISSPPSLVPPLFDGPISLPPSPPPALGIRPSPVETVAKLADFLYTNPPKKPNHQKWLPLSLPRPTLPSSSPMTESRSP